ncbi:MAG: hypothetical protein ABI407_12550, partial [Bradyrhizobium sp.]
DSGQSVGRMIEQHRRLQVEWFQQTSVWLQTWSLSTPHGIFVASAPRNDGGGMRALAYAFTEGRSPTRANHAAMLVDGLLRHSDVLFRREHADDTRVRPDLIVKLHGWLPIFVAGL